MRLRLAALAALAACTLPAETADDGASPSQPPLGESAELVQVDDGDTLTVRIDGREERVRLIGINAPERDECLSDQARTRLAELAGGDSLVMVADVDDRDRFDRLLRYAYSDGQLLNATLAAEGLALARPFEPNTSRQAELEAAEDEARQSGRGIWDPAACGAVDAEVEVVHVEADPPGRDLEGEYVAIRNEGATVDLSDWSVRDETSQNRYDFPSGFSLEVGAEVRIYSGCGTDGVAELYWCSDRPVWDNAGDTAFLVSPTGSIHSSYGYGG